jgi:hypothetical protein
MAIVYTKNDQGRYVYVCDSAPVHSANSGDTAIDVTNGIFYIYTTSWIALGSGGAGGSGTLNYIPKWTPDGTTLGNSLLRDDGTSLSIGIAPVSTRRLLSYSNTHQQSIYGLNQTTTGAGTGVYGKSDGATIGSQNYGVQGYAGGATGASSHNIGVLGSGGSSIALPALTDGVHIGVWGNASAASTDAIGLGAYSKTSNSSDNIGIYVNVGNTGAGNAYIGILQDGSEASGSFLKCIDASGTATWGVLNERDVQIRTVSGFAFFGSTFDFLCANYLIGEFSGGTQNVTITFNSPQEGQTYSMVFIQSASLIDLTLPTGYWLNDTAPFDFSTELASTERAMITATYLNSTWYFAVKKLQLV